MAKRIRYKFLAGQNNVGTEEEPIYEDFIIDVDGVWSERDEEIAKLEAYNGEYEIYDDGISIYPTADHNIVAGEYVTANGVLYKAIMNIPNGGSIITGQNAVVTTVEEQLYELTKGE